MRENFDNRTRALADVVSLEAWHDSFGQETPKVNLYTDVVFREARLGGEDASKVRFRLSIKRAELIVIIPETEPLSVDPSSVSRDNSNISIKKTQTLKNHSAASGGVDIKIPVDIGSLSGNGQASISSGMSSDTSLELVENASAIKITQTRTPEGNYRWELSPAFEKSLSGRPWHPTEAPRLKLIDLRPDRSKGIPPVVNIEVKCLREDLSITDIEIKESDVWKRISSAITFRNKQIAAEAYIRNKLMAEGLEFGNLGDSYATVVLAKISASSASE